MSKKKKTEFQKYKSIFTKLKNAYEKNPMGIITKKVI